MLEKVIERKLGEYVRTHLKGLYYKFTSPAKRSVPDRLIVLPCPTCPTCGNSAKVVFLELKRGGQKPTTAQANEILKLTEHGAISSWADNLDEAKQYLHEIQS